MASGRAEMIGVLLNLEPHKEDIQPIVPRTRRKDRQSKMKRKRLSAPELSVLNAICVKH